MSLSPVWQHDIKHVFVFPCRSARSHVCSYSWIPTLSQAASAILWHHSNILGTNFTEIFPKGFWPFLLWVFFCFLAIWFMLLWYLVIFYGIFEPRLRICQVYFLLCFQHLILVCFCVLSLLCPHLIITCSDDFVPCPYVYELHIDLPLCQNVRVTSV